MSAFDQHYDARLLEQQDFKDCVSEEVQGYIRDEHRRTWNAAIEAAAHGIESLAATDPGVSVTQSDGAETIRKLKAGGDQ